MFGAVTQQSGSLGSEQQFAGQQTDPDGLQYLRARFYDPSTGRFLSRDSWSNDDKTAFHPYVYASNNPTTATDPSGRCSDEDPKCPEPTFGDLPTSPQGGEAPPGATEEEFARQLEATRLAQGVEFAERYAWTNGADLYREYYTEGRGKEFLNEHGEQLSFEEYAAGARELFNVAAEYGEAENFQFKIVGNTLYTYDYQSNTLILANGDTGRIFDMWKPSAGRDYFLNSIPGNPIDYLPPQVPVIPFPE